MLPNVTNQSWLVTRRLPKSGRFLTLRLAKTLFFTEILRYCVKPKVSYMNKKNRAKFSLSKKTEFM